MTFPLILVSVDHERVSPQLAPLLHGVYSVVQARDVDLVALSGALESLLTYLASANGRTHANCVATDSFFLHNDRWDRHWEHLPPPFQNLLGDLGGALHDTISAPEIAENFDSTPEQLLAQLRCIGHLAPPV